MLGAALVRRPGLFKAVVSHVGIDDMLRDGLWPNGELTVTEFSSVKNRAQFQALLAYSPYHPVADGTAYPTVLLRVDVDAGHGQSMALGSAIEQQADVFAFLLDALGMK